MFVWLMLSLLIEFGLGIGMIEFQVAIRRTSGMTLPSGANSKWLAGCQAGGVEMRFQGR